MAGRKRIRRKFEETRLGHLLKHEVPLEYDLIMKANGGSGAPTADFIEAISYASDNLFFRKAKFRRCLIEYRKRGLYCGRPVKCDAQTELYYIRLRKQQR